MITNKSSANLTVSLGSKSLSDTVYQHCVMRTRMPARCDMMGRAIFQIVARITIDIYTFIKYVESILIGKSMLCTPITAGTKSQRKIIIHICQVRVHHHFACIFIPYHFLHILWSLSAINIVVNHTIQPKKNICTKARHILPCIPTGISITDATSEEISKSNSYTCWSRTTAATITKPTAL